MMGRSWGYTVVPGQGSSHARDTHISQVEGDLQVTPEVVGEVRVHVQYLEQVVPLDLVQIAVGEGAHICAGLAGPCVQTNGLAEDVILA